MYYIVETAKSFTQATTDLETAVKTHGFGVLHIHDLGATLRSKGIAFSEQCKVFEVCNSGQAANGSLSFARFLSGGSIRTVDSPILPSRTPERCAITQRLALDRLR